MKDTIELLRAYKQLLDEGVITAEEFSKKKAELLAGKDADQAQQNAQQSNINYNNTQTINASVNNASSMSAKTTGIISYITWIGFIVAICAGDREHAIFHINQALVVNLASIAAALIMWIPFLGWVVGGAGSVFVLICWIMGLVNAVNEEKKEVPLIGQIHILDK